MDTTIEFGEAMLEKSEQGYFFIRTNNLLTRVNVADILWVNADGNYCYIHTLQKKHAVKISMKKLTTKLSCKYFVQIHKSYIVQLQFIEIVDTKENIVRIGETNLPLGRIYKEKLLPFLDII
ncbi:MAG: LytTR family transcriptional regulator [Saprospiraceae bacterium]|nr:LytTR family transcriptional regulator [Saprospiraceae bacterium]